MSHSIDIDKKIDEFGRRLALYKANPSQLSNHDLSERLRVARLNATQLHNKTWKTTAQSIQVVKTQANGTLSLQGGPSEGLTPWFKFASALPLIALVAGLFFISEYTDENRAQQLAPLDVAILTDALPPQAYSDPGFSTYLRLQGQLDSE